MQKKFNKYTTKKPERFLLGLLPVEILHLIYCFLSTIDVCRYVINSSFFFLKKKRFALASSRFYKYAFSWMKSIKIERHMNANKMLKFILIGLNSNNSNVRHLCIKSNKHDNMINKNTLEAVYQNLGCLESLVIVNCGPCILNTDDHNRLLESFSHLKKLRIKNPNNFDLKYNQISKKSLTTLSALYDFGLNIKINNKLLSLLNPSTIERLDLEYFDDPTNINLLANFTSLKELKISASSNNSNDYLINIIEKFPLEKIEIGWFFNSRMGIDTLISKLNPLKIKSFVTGMMAGAVEKHQLENLKTFTKMTKFGLIGQECINDGLFVPISALNITNLKLDNVKFINVKGKTCSHWLDPILKMNLVKVTFKYIDIQGSILKQLGKIKTLKTLKLCNIQTITNNTINGLLGESNISYLSIEYCQCTEKSIKDLKFQPNITIHYTENENSSSCLNGIINKTNQIGASITNIENFVNYRGGINLYVDSDGTVSSFSRGVRERILVLSNDCKLLTSKAPYSDILADLLFYKKSIGDKLDDYKWRLKKLEECISPNF